MSNISVSEVILELERLGQRPNKSIPVTQGALEFWRLGQRLLPRLRTGAWKIDGHEALENTHWDSIDCPIADYQSLADELASMLGSN